MSDGQHLDDIMIPDIEIESGWSVSEVETLDDCNDAFAFLMSAVAEIEYELELHDLGTSRFVDPAWPIRAKRALKYKKTALQLVNLRRGQIAEEAKRAAQHSRDSQLLAHIKSVVAPSQWQCWVTAFCVGAAKDAA